MTYPLYAALALFSLLSPAVAAQDRPSNLVENPGFEQRPLGWTFSTDPDLRIDTGVCAAPCTLPRSGQNAAFKNHLGGGAGTIRQSIRTTAGHRYRVQVSLARISHHPPTADDDMLAAPGRTRCG